MNMSLLNRNSSLLNSNEESRSRLVLAQIVLIMSDHNQNTCRMRRDAAKLLSISLLNISNKRIYSI